MRIIHSCPSESYSGLEQYALALAQDQKQRGHEVYFIVAAETELCRSVEEAGIKAVRLPRRLRLGFLSFVFSVASLLKNKKFDVIHIHSTQEVLNFCAVKFFGVLWNIRFKKAILQCHLWVSHSKKDLWHRILYGQMDEVWGSSEQACKSLAQNLPLPQNKIKRVSYGRDIEVLKGGFLSKTEARRALNLGQDFQIWGTVSRIEKSKGLWEWMLGMQPVMKQNPLLHLVHIGGVSPRNSEAERYNAKLKSQVQSWEESLRERVHFLGPIPESYRYLKAFDIYVLPSYLETFSLSVLDAQLAGLPVLGTHSGGTPDVVIEGQTGWLMNPEDIESVSQTAQRAIKDVKNWQDFGQNAAALVTTAYGQKNVFENILRNYE